MRAVVTLFVFLCLSLSQWVLADSNEYQVGGGDVLEVKVFGEPELDRVVRVSADGVISLPLIGRVNVNGLTPLQVADRVTVLFGKDYLVNPQVTVYVKEYVSKQVQILGAVKAPGMYNFTG